MSRRDDMDASDQHPKAQAEGGGRLVTASRRTNERAIRGIFAACRALTEATGRPFSPDGHLVGSIGEVLAADHLGLDLMPPSTAGYDAVDPGGAKVEIKTTTRGSIALSAHGTSAERLVVVLLDDQGVGTIVYDGPCAPVWAAAGKAQRNGQRQITLTTLARLQVES